MVNRPAGALDLRVAAASLVEVKGQKRHFLDVGGTRVDGNDRTTLVIAERINPAPGEVTDRQCPKMVVIKIERRAVGGGFTVLGAEGEGGLNDFANAIIIQFMGHSEPGDILIDASGPFILPIGTVQGGQPTEFPVLFAPNPVRYQMRIENNF